MKQLLQQYAAYNLWANNLITGQITTLNSTLIEKEIVSSFSSIYKTLLHMMEVENVWWERLKNGEQINAPGWFAGSCADLCQKLVGFSRQWEQFVTQNDQKSLEASMHYKHPSGKYYTEPLYQVLLHLFNHQTYHRGQLVTMLRQCGLTQIESTDFITYVRKIDQPGN